jgi:RNA polymerase sigma-19 factor, ECF subfamily
MNVLKSYSDSELVVSLCNGDEPAFNEIYKRHWQGMYHSAYNILQEEDPCLDIVQEVFVWLWNNREKLDVSSLRSYLISAVKYKVANHIRHGKVRRNFFEDVLRYKQDVFNDESFEVKELKEIITRFTEKLPERSRQIFHLSRNEHLSNREIAEEMGISEKTVENQMTIALRKLRISLGRLSFWILFI